jgi:hypothetical protein
LLGQFENGALRLGAFVRRSHKSIDDASHTFSELCCASAEYLFKNAHY